MMSEMPHRKPVGSGLQPPASQVYSHSRSRTTSSNTFPSIQYTPPPQQRQPPHPQNMPTHLMQGQYASRRSPSTNTFSSMAPSGNGPVPFRQSGSSQDLQRSASGRQGASPTSYVALMRRQKATVWCDRSQHEDPRIVAAQRAAKARAVQEVTGARTSTLGGSSRVTAKIRHHGKANLVGYSPGDLASGGVPLRLSATEVEGEDDDDDTDSANLPYGRRGSYHQRTGSGRSSIGSARKGLTYSRQSGASSLNGRWSSGNTPPSERRDSMADLVEAGETPVPTTAQASSTEYFATSGTMTGSMGSSSSGERADDVPDLEVGTSEAARMASNSVLKSTLTREQSLRNPEALRRRGSVDDRSMTMTLAAGRLYIANPDADSD